MVGYRPTGSSEAREANPLPGGTNPSTKHLRKTGINKIHHYETHAVAQPHPKEQDLSCPCQYAVLSSNALPMGNRR